MTVPSTCLGLPIILASASPRRRELLREAGISFEVVVSDASEPLKGEDESCADYARRVAELKARPVAIRHPGRLTLGADTIVVVDNQVLGKPADADEAGEMLRRLSGRAHQVMTGVALLCVAATGEAWVDSRVAETRVVFHDLTPTQIDDYVASGEPLDKAGSYGIQGLGGRLVAGYDGSYTNVVGLPMETVMGMLTERRDVTV